jgi:hypothetical protein
VRKATVILGGQEYGVNELPVRPNARWRARLQKELGGIVDLVENVTNSQTDQITAKGLAGLARGISDKLFGSVDLITELLFEYSPELTKDRKRIEETSFESEIIDAFLQVLGLAFPFGAWVSRLASLGLKAGQTSPSSPSQPGESGTMSSTS